MSIDGGSSKGGDSGLDTNLQQGAFEFGPSQFDLGAITDAVSGNQIATTDRYDQLGMGGSTPEQQDLTQQGNLGQAAIGQEQTADVGNPAFNPALQTAETNLTSGQVTSANQSSGGGILGTLGSLAGLAAKAL
jgi:hypothetical protein